MFLHLTFLLEYIYSFLGTLFPKVFIFLYIYALFLYIYSMYCCYLLFFHIFYLYIYSILIFFSHINSSFKVSKGEVIYLLLLYHIFYLLSIALFFLSIILFFCQLFMVATQQSQIKSRTRSQLSLLGITCPNLKVLLSCAFTPLSGNCSFFSNTFNRIFYKMLFHREKTLVCTCQKSFGFFLENLLL